MQLIGSILHLLTMTYNDTQVFIAALAQIPCMVAYEKVFLS